MGLFSTPKTWAQLAAEVPPERKTWIVAVGSVGANPVKDSETVGANVAAIESAGWDLVALVPAAFSSGSLDGTGGSISTTMLGHFRRT